MPFWKFVGFFLGCRMLEKIALAIVNWWIDRPMRKKLNALIDSHLKTCRREDCEVCRGAGIRLGAALALRTAFFTRAQNQLRNAWHGFLGVLWPW